MIQKGDQAPDFELPSADGKLTRLSNFKGKRPVVIFFYPRDETPGCIKEACTFRDHYEQFQKAGVEVIGISSDPPETHKKFAGRHRLPFLLLSDQQGKIRQLYRIPKTWGLLPGRVTLVIDRNGVVRNSFSSQWNPARHVEESLKLLREL